MARMVDGVTNNADDIAVSKDTIRVGRTSFPTDSIESVAVEVNKKALTCFSCGPIIIVAGSLSQWYMADDGSSEALGRQLVMMFVGIGLGLSVMIFGVIAFPSALVLKTATETRPILRTWRGYKVRSIKKAIDAVIQPRR